MLSMWQSAYISGHIGKEMPWIKLQLRKQTMSYQRLPGFCFVFVPLIYQGQQKSCFQFDFENVLVLYFLILPF